MSSVSEPHASDAAASSSSPAPTAAVTAAAPSVDPSADPLFSTYLRECAAAGVRDLQGLPMQHVAPYLSLNQYHRDALSRSIPLAPVRLYRTAQELLQKNTCVSCWLTHCCCMCAQMRGLHMRHKVFVLMHHAEFGRGSNTGKLAVRTGAPLQVDADTQDVTAASALIQTDIPLQERALLELCEREPLNTVVLFPSSESISIDEFCRMRGWSLPPKRPEYFSEPNAAAGGAGAASVAAAAAASSDGAIASPAPVSVENSAATSASALPPCPPLNIILLDGTWRQARKMKFLLPAHILSLRIDPFKYRLDGTLRAQGASVDAAVAAEMAAADGEQLDSYAPEITAAAAAVSWSDASAAPAAPAVNGKGKKAPKPKLSQRDTVHRDGKRAPQSSPSPDGLIPATPTFVSLFYPLRKQSQPDRISTVEALVLLLMELCEPPQTTWYLLDLLRVLVDSMRAQCGMRGVYATYTEEQSRQMRIDNAMARDRRTQSELQAAAARAAGAGSEVDSSASTAPGIQYLSRRERRQHAVSMKPCLQWNRGGAQPCTSTPCRYSHTCMVCGGEHRAIACSSTDAQQALADSLRNTRIARDGDAQLQVATPGAANSASAS